MLAEVSAVKKHDDRWSSQPAVIVSLHMRDVLAPPEFGGAQARAYPKIVEKKWRQGHLSRCSRN